MQSVLQVASASSKAVEGVPGIVVVGLAPRCPNPPLDGVNPEPQRWMQHVDNLVTHVSDVGARLRAAGS